MPEYRRFVAYFYEYIDGKKQKNTGFAKVELRNGTWRILFRLTAPVHPGPPVEVYGFVRKGDYLLGLPMGTMRAGKEMMEEWAYHADEPLWMGTYGLSDISGIWIQSGDGRHFITVWDEEPVDTKKFVTELPKEDAKETVKTEKQDSEIISEKMIKGDSAKTAGEMTEEIEEGETREAEKELSGREAGVSGKELSGRAAGVSEKELSGREAGVSEEELSGDAVGISEEEPSEGTAGVSAEELSGREAGVSEEELSGRAAGVSEKELSEDAIGISEEELSGDTVGVSEEELSGRAAGVSEEELSGNAAGVSEEDLSGKSERLHAAGQSERRAEDENALQMRKQSEKQAGLSDNHLKAADVGVMSENISVSEQENRKLWDELYHRRSRFQPFTDQEISDCIRVAPNDIIKLQCAHWRTGRNSFLMHGYYNYRHLMIGRTEDGRYVLGVPGIMNPQEKYLAVMFGFPNFKFSDGTKQEAAGYWYRILEQRIPQESKNNHL